MPQQQPEINEVRVPQKSSAGATAGIIIIIFLLVFGAFYTWGKKLNEQNKNIQRAAASTTQE